MLTTLIYQSRLIAECNHQELMQLAQIASVKNSAMGVTGILLYNGSEFFQILEGEEIIVDALFEQISRDSRHADVVELMRDYSAYRRFSSNGMTFFNVQKIDLSTLLEDIRDINKKSYLPDDRVSRFIKRFTTQGGWYTSSLHFKPTQWKMVSNRHTRPAYLDHQETPLPYSFAFQPIVEPITGHVRSYEALIRDSTGRSPEEIFATIPFDSLYDFDLQSKSMALKLASSILRPDEKISINLLPGALYSREDSVKLLLEHIEQAGLRPDQIIIELLETELITQATEFNHKLKEIRVAGIGLAIDDFGSGYSRFSLLSSLQPDKIKLDRSLIIDIHKNGAKQAIIVSIVNYCEDMGISLVVEGVEKIEEWCWLQSVGIRLFQGFLFAKPCLKGVGEIFWPIKID